MSDITIEVGGQWTFADHGTDFVGGAAGTSLEQAGSVDVQMDMTSVADDAARQSVQVDLGVNRPARISVDSAEEMAATPATGERIDYFWNASPDGTAGNGNMGYTTGTDVAYAGGVATLDEGLGQLIFIGSMIMSADATGTVQVQHIGILVPPERYGSLIKVNRSGAAYHSDAVETHTVFNQMIDDVA